MTTIAKAKLAKLDAAKSPSASDEHDVQFNPATLRVQISNKSAGGAQAGSQTRQKPGEGTTTVTFDLIFDSADEGTTADPVDVRGKVAIVERFVRPQGAGKGKEASPRVRFTWGTFQIDGSMESLSVEYDLFAANGTPLRAKCSVSIKGQDSAYAYRPDEPVTPSQGAPGAGGGGGGVSGKGPGPAGSGAPGTTPAAAPGALAGIARALDGESLASLAARAGLPPEAWRSLSFRGGDPLKLPAGLEVALPALAAPPNGGASSGGALAGAPAAPPPAANPLSAASRPGASTPPPVNPVAQTRAGGLTASLAAGRQATHTAQAAALKTDFGLRANERAASAANPGLLKGAPRRTGAAEADDRPYGFGLPLKPHRAVAAVEIAAPTQPPGSAGTGNRPRQSGPSSPCGCGG